MPVSRNALIRYKTIDNCLKNRYRKWTLEDLIDACSDALYEYEGIDKGISKRTIQLDIQMMRSEKLGYNAPIVVQDHKYYTYEDPDYSITNTPLSENDLKVLSESVGMLKQLSGFSSFSGMEDIVSRLEDHVAAVRFKAKPVIFFETNERLAGLQYISVLYQAIVEKRPLVIKYKSFKAISSHDFVFSPYALKEYRNRWFVFGRRQGAKMLLNLALDRILEINEAPSSTPFIVDEDFDPELFFQNVVGVTKGPGQASARVRFLANEEQSNYIKTKPLHGSQRLCRTHSNGSCEFEIKVVLNYELETVFLGFGEGVKVLSPAILAKKISHRLSAAACQYDNKAQEADNLQTLQE